MSVNVVNAACSSCRALTRSGSVLEFDSSGLNSFGGSMSVLNVGAYAWSISILGIGSSSVALGGLTRVEALHVSISNSAFGFSQSISRERLF
jgi:hypothetical protein